MAGVESAIAESAHFFIGEDRPLLYYVTSDGSTAQTMTGWALTWELLDRRGGTVLLTKTVGSGIALSNGNGTNDLATVTIEDTDLEANVGVSAQIGHGVFFSVLRRTDAGTERVLAFGDVHIQEASI
jgi:hypothetical protein